MSLSAFNVLMFLSILMASFGFTLVMHKLFGKEGLFAATGLMLVLGNLVVLITFDIGGFAMNVLSIYGGVFLATDLLNEFYGKKAAQKAVFFGFVVQCGVLLIMTLVTMVIPNEAGQTSHNALSHLFAFMPKIMFASLTAYYIASMTDVYIYDKLKAKQPKRSMIFVRNNVSTFAGKLVDSIIFFGMMGVLGVFPLSIAGQLVMTGIIGKWLVAALDTPFVYFAAYFINRDKPKEEKVWQGIRVADQRK